MPSEQQLIQYEVDVRDPDTGFWQCVLPIRPRYEYKTGLKTFRFLWFVWKRKRRVIVNRAHAETRARKRAIFHARHFFKRRETRVRSRWSIGGFDCVDTIWQNGKFID